MRRAISSASKSLRTLGADHRDRPCDPNHRDRSRGRLALVAALVPTALAAVALFPAAAGAATRSFHVYNASSYPLRLVSSYGDFSGGHPAANSVLMPGVGYDDWELTYYFGSSTQGGASYQIRNDQGVAIGTFEASMQIYSINTNQTLCEVQPLRTAPGAALGTCSPAGLNFVDGNTLTYLDPPGTVHNIPASQGQAQANTLNQLCAEDNSATCTFTPTSETHVDTPTHQVGGSVANDTDNVEVDQAITISDTVGGSNSVGVDVKVGGKIAGVVDVSVTGHYSHEWTYSHTFTQTIHTNVPAHTKVWIDATQPMLRDTGNFAFTLGNTTWNLYGVYFDSPDPNGNSGYVIKSAPLTSKERLEALPPFRGPQVLRGSYKLPTSASVGAIAQPKLHLSVAGPSSVHRGQIASYRITLSRNQPDNRVVYTLKNMQVFGYRAGHRVGHWTVAKLPRIGARTLLLKTTVPGANGPFCLAFNATAEHAVGAHARACAATTSAPTGGLG